MMTKKELIEWRREMYEERAAICEYDGEDLRGMAQIKASDEVKELNKNGYFKKNT